jgi:hypothetical protein
MASPSKLDAMKTTQAERDEWRHECSSDDPDWDCIWPDDTIRLLDDADRCAELEAELARLREGLTTLLRVYEPGQGGPVHRDTLSIELYALMEVDE